MDYQYYPKQWQEPFKSRRKACGLKMYSTLNIARDDKQRQLDQWAANYRAFDAPVALFFFLNEYAEQGSYLDYGMFTPIQVAAIHALDGPQECVKEIRNMYQDRRDALCSGLDSIGWIVEKPKATMFVWALIPEEYKKMGSLEFSKKILNEARVAVSPGIGFGEYGDDHVRFSLIENEHRTRQAIRGLREMFKKDKVGVFRE